MEFSRQEYWSGFLCLLQDFPNPGIKLTSLCLLHWQVDSFPLCHLESPKSTLRCLPNRNAQNTFMLNSSMNHKSPKLGTT